MLLSLLDKTTGAILKKVDERWSLKLVHRKLQILARVLIVGTFLDDAIRIATDYFGQRESMQIVGFPFPVACMLPVLFVVTQSTGVALVLLGEARAPQLGCLILGGWTAVHPFLYLQHHNLEFVLESLTLIGGLLILASSERLSLKVKVHRMADTRHLQPEAYFTALDWRVHTVCTSAVFVYYVLKMIHERVQSLLGNKAEEEVTTALIEGSLLVLLFIITGFLVAGMRSRWCAGLLAIIMAVAAVYKHPWFLTVWSSKMYTLDFVIGYEGTQVPGWVYSTHQRYFFFQQISTTGALLQLVVHGPGKYSLDEALGPMEIASVTSKGVD